LQKKIPVFLKILGIVLIIVGLVAAYYGPLEIFVFYLFSEGGRFYYDGFGVGSFWFAALVVQNLGYYIIAALCLPVGIGYVRLRRWALTLTQLYLWFWLGVGIWLIGNGVLLIPSLCRIFNRNVLFLQLTILGVSSCLFLILLPALALWFYRSRRVRAVFEAHDPHRYWTESYPFPLLALLLLYVILIIVLHVAIFFQGLFPMFGQIMLGRPSAYVIALGILILGILIYGTARLKIWAWWGSLVFVSLLTSSALLSFSGYRFYDIILMMDLPAFEMGLIDKMVFLHDYPLVGVFVFPLLAALGLIIYSKRYYV
jgi:hypothetical protein